MKININMKYVIAILIFTVAGCREYNNPVDPDAKDYIGYESVDHDNDGVPSYLDIDEVFLIYPGDNGTADSVIPHLEVSRKKPGIAEAFHVQIATDDTFSSLLIDKDDFISNICAVATDILENETLYYWRARIFDGSRWSNDWSTPGSFITSQSFKWRTKLVQTNGDDYGFPTSVDQDGDYVIGGDEYGNTANDGGAAYIYRRTSNGTWDGIELTPSDSEYDDYFGSSVVIDGDYCAVRGGAVYIYRRTGLNEWSDEYIISSLGYGDSFDLDGDYLLSGNSIYYRTGPGNTWDTGYNIYMHEAAISGDYIISGEPDDSDIAVDAGAAVISMRTGINDWADSTRIYAPDAAQGDHFGSVVAIAGDYASVLARNDETGRNIIYIFYRTGPENVWNFQFKIDDQEDYWVKTISMTSELLAVGIPIYKDDGGKVKLYERTDANSWTFVKNFFTRNPDSGTDASSEKFGEVLSISRNMLVVGNTHYINDRSGRIDIYY